MNLGELWTAILEIIAQVLIPVWNDLIQYLPLLLVFAILGIVGVIIWMWWVNSKGNASRVPKPLPAGRKPEDMHLPGPSLWPFVAPVGLLFILFAVALGPLESLLNLALLLFGVTVAVIGVVGWYLDANKEYVTVEAGGHGTPEETAEVLAILERVGAAEYTRMRAREHRDEALAQLESVDTVDPASMERLSDVVRGVISA